MSAFDFKLHQTEYIIQFKYCYQINLDNVSNQEIKCACMEDSTLLFFEGDDLEWPL